MTGGHPILTATTAALAWYFAVRPAAASEEHDRYARRGYPEVHDAALKGDVDTLKRLLAEDPKLVDARDSSGCTPLHWAAREANLDAARVLLEAGADVNARNNEGKTPLHEVLASPYSTIPTWRMVAFLAGRGADPLIPDADGNTPLRLARMSRIIIGGHVDWADVIKMKEDAAKTEHVIAMLEGAIARQELARAESQFRAAATCALVSAGLLGLGFGVIAVKIIGQRRKRRADS
jgi:hypothetical protein